jgi:hypothetical protein
MNLNTIELHIVLTDTTKLLQRNSKIYIMQSSRLEAIRRGTRPADDESER